VINASQTIGLRYQPIIQLATMRADSAEVLARTIQADGTVTGPASIVAAMTSTQESMALTSLIIQLAVDEYVRWDFASLNLNFAFNLPLDAMLHPDLIAITESIRRAAGLPADKIRFELTERHPVSDIASAGAIITGLRQAGYGVALDDVTPSMFNLDALLNLAIQAIKLDYSITTSTAPDDQAFIRGIAKRAKANGLHVIAEGIETAATLATMRALGITHGQGYLFAEPLTAAGLIGFQREFRSP
jgi:EAL domain-containing protein (putative c-di-GMP-specific phosphodiesterase class I)